MQRAGDAKKGLVHFIHLRDKMFICATYKCCKQALVPFIHLWDKKINIPQKSHLSVQRARDAKQHHKTSHKNHDYLWNVQITQSKIMFINATYR